MADHPKSFEESIAAVCRLPVEYRARGNVSWFDLVKESGYSTHREEITEKRLEDHLREHPELVRVWVYYSEDQRSSPTWFIGRPEAGRRDKWIVAFYVKRGSVLNQEHLFDDDIRACAFFIKRMMEPDPVSSRGCMGCLGVLAMLGVVFVVGRICHGST